MMPASTPPSAVISVPVPVKKAGVIGVLSHEASFAQKPDPPNLLYASNSPPGLCQDIPIFLRVCTFLN
jgi:hypothetical protein